MAAKNEQQFLWRGNIEWKYLVKTSTIPQPKTKLFPCGMVCQSQTDEDRLNAGSWPKTLSLHLLRKHVMVDIMKKYLKRSTIVRFYVSNSKVLNKLSGYISTEYVGCLRLLQESQSETSDIKIILLLYTPAKNTYVGLIPGDQIQFIDDMTKLICTQDHTNNLKKEIQGQDIEDSDINEENIVTSTEHPTVASRFQEIEKTRGTRKRKFVEDVTNLPNASNTTDAETVNVSEVQSSFKKKKYIKEPTNRKIEQRLRSNGKSISDIQDDILLLINQMKVMCSNFFITSDEICTEYIIKDSVRAERLLVAVAKCRSLIQRTKKDLHKFDDVLDNSYKNLCLIESSSTESGLSADLIEVENSKVDKHIRYERTDLHESKTLEKTTPHHTKIPNLVDDSTNIIDVTRLKSEPVSPSMIFAKSNHTEISRKTVSPKYSRIESSESEESDFSRDSPLQASSPTGLSHNADKLNGNDKMLQSCLNNIPRNIDETTSSIVTRLSANKQSFFERLSLYASSTVSNLSGATAKSCSPSDLNVSTKKRKVPEKNSNKQSSPQFRTLDAKLLKNCEVVLEKLELPSTVESVNMNDQIGHDINKITPSVLLKQKGCGTSNELPGQCSLEISNNVTVRKNRPNFLTLNNLPLGDSKSCDTGKSTLQKKPQKKKDEIAESRVCYQPESLIDITNAKSASADDASRFSSRDKSISTKNVTRNSNSKFGMRSKFFEQMTTSVDQETNDRKSISNLKPAVLMLDLGEKSKKSFVTVHPALAAGLKPHQVQGIRFMWNKCVKSSEDVENTDAFGCILAHGTGSGKTFQVVALTHTLCMHPETGVKRVMIVCPLIVISHWIAEYETRLKHVNGDKDLKIYRIERLAQGSSHLLQLQTWHKNGGVMIVSFNMFKRVTDQVEKPMKKHQRKTIVKCLIDPGPDLIVCDEGHMLKSEDSDLSRSLSRVKTLRRIVLTSKSLQDHLSKYHCMMQFVRPKFLGTKEEFAVKFVKPIINGQFQDSSEAEVSCVETKFHILHKMLEGSVQRFDYSVITPYLPPKQEYVISIRLTKVQAQLYQYCLNNLRGQKSNETLYLDYQALQKIWTHPCLSTMIFGILKKKNTAKSKDVSINSESSIDSSVSDNVQFETKTNLQTDYCQIEEEKQFPSCKKWWTRFLSTDHMKDIRSSSKLTFFFSILKKCEKVGDKVLFLSESFRTLSLVEKFLSQMPPRRAPDNNTVQWVAGTDYFRLDRDTSVEKKRRYCKMFNNPEQSRARLFLVSTRTIMLGIEFSGANRVVIFDAGRDPLHDVEKILKVYRFGQRKPCYIYRLLSHGTMEEKIYNSQFSGLRLSSEVYDQQQHERFYKNLDITELYKFEPNTSTNEITLHTPRDELLARILAKHKDLINSCYEYDSLLENRIHQIMQGFEID